MNRVGDIAAVPARRTDLSNSSAGGSSFPNSAPRKVDVNTGPMGENNRGTRGKNKKQMSSFDATHQCLNAVVYMYNKTDISRMGSDSL